MRYGTELAEQRLYREAMPSLTTRDLAQQLANLLNGVIQGWEVEQKPTTTSEACAGFAQSGGDRFQAWVRSPASHRAYRLDCQADRAVTPDEVRLMQRIVAVF